MELVEDLLHVVLGNTGAGIPYLQLHLLTAHAQGQHDASVAGVAQCIGHEVLQYAPQQPTITAYPGAACEHMQTQATAGRYRGVLRGQFTYQHAGVEIGDGRAQAAGIQPRHIQQAVQQLFGRTQRGIDALGQMPLLVGLRQAVAQRRCKQACRVQRLQHVVADRGQEARLRLLRRFGSLRALGDTLLQRFVGFQQRLLDVLEIGDVVVAGDVTTTGQRLPAQLDHLAVGTGALEHMR